MGDYFQTVVAREVSPPEALHLAERMREWLVGEGIIAPTMPDCALGGDGKGYPPGPNFERAIVGPDHGTRALWTNGLAIISRLMVDKITTMPKQKLGARIGRLGDDDLLRLNRAMMVFLGLAG